MKKSNSISYNRYDLMILVLIISQISGRYFGIMNPILFVVLLFSPYLFKSLQGSTKKLVKPFWLFFAFWTLYNFCSLLWAPLFVKSLYHCFLFFINFLLFLEIIVFSDKTSKPHSTIAIGWLIAFLLTSFVGLWELRTGHHLSIAKEHLSRENFSADEAIGSYTSVTFYNINTYAIYILEVIPFLFYTMASKSTIKMKVLAFYCGLIAMVFLFVDGSRGASISLVVMFLVFIYFMLKGDKRNIAWIILIIGVLVYVFCSFGDAILGLILYRMENSGFEDNSRMVLYEKSLELIVNSCGIGTGVGSMVPAMEAQGNMYNIFFSHNLFLEFLMQFGFIIFLGFLYYLYKLFILARKVQLSSKVVVYCALFGLPFYSIINSEYTHLHYVWCYFASLFVYASSNYADNHAYQECCVKHSARFENQVNKGRG